ncbi:unnamed protein product [Ranitomeya imitator]|uniref:Ycf15 n=1 Tax=Ranitomeya imitator TaxID=111125 RepID=A0ABN9MBJ4_9NEOB|nr:unnamed protein product [Ranitomeya imitator]
MDLGPRGGDLSRRLAKKECQWIYRLGTLTPQGLNESFGQWRPLNNKEETPNPEKETKEERENTNKEFI